MRFNILYSALSTYKYLSGNKFSQMTKRRKKKIKLIICKCTNYMYITYELLDGLLNVCGVDKKRTYPQIFA